MDPDRPTRITLVEDDVKLSGLIREYLEGNGFAVAVEGRGDVAARAILHRPPDLVILDVMLPGIDGREVCKVIRQGYQGPVLMLSALGGEMDQVIGLELGADDYLAKPVNPRLLLSRINALLRRTRHSARALRGETGGGATPGMVVRVNGLAVDPASRRVEIDGRPVELSTAEFDLLHLMAAHPGTVLSRRWIYRELRGLEYDGVDRSIDLRVARLRKKLGDDARRPRLIKSIHGEGYLLVRNT